MKKEGNWEGNLKRGILGLYIKYIFSLVLTVLRYYLIVILMIIIFGYEVLFFNSIKVLFGF